jgi:hypothetical protein
MSDGLLLLPSEGSGTLAHPGLIQGLACNSHGDDESLLLSRRGGLRRGSGVILLPLSSDSLLLIDEEVGGAARPGWQDSGG